MRTSLSALLAPLTLWLGCQAPPPPPVAPVATATAPAAATGCGPLAAPAGDAPPPGGPDGHTVARVIGPRGDVELTIGKGAVLWSATTGAPLAWTPTMGGVADGVILADGSAVVSVPHDNQVVALAAGRPPRVIARVGGFPSFAADGSGSFASDEGSDEFALYNARGEQRVRLRGTIVAVGAPPVGVVWRNGDLVSWMNWTGAPSRSVPFQQLQTAMVARDGRRLLLIGESQSAYGLVVDADGSTVMRLRWPSHNFRHSSGWAPPTVVDAAFSADGAKLVVAVHRPGGYQGFGPTKDTVMVVDLATKTTVARLDASTVSKVGWRGDAVTIGAYHVPPEGGIGTTATCFSWRQGMRAPVEETCPPEVAPPQRWRGALHDLAEDPPNAVLGRFDESTFSVAFPRAEGVRVERDRAWVRRHGDCAVAEARLVVFDGRPGWLLYGPEGTDADEIGRRWLRGPITPFFERAPR